jgi:hypothetical protein
MSQALGPSGWVAKTFLQSEITPLLALIGLLMGVFAVMVTPREEEPQINVTFAKRPQSRCSLKLPVLNMSTRYRNPVLQS